MIYHRSKRQRTRIIKVRVLDLPPGMVVHFSDHVPRGQMYKIEAPARPSIRDPWRIAALPTSATTTYIANPTDKELLPHSEIVQRIKVQFKPRRGFVYP